MEDKDNGDKDNGDEDDGDDNSMSIKKENVSASKKKCDDALKNEVLMSGTILNLLST